MPIRHTIYRSEKKISKNHNSIVSMTNKFRIVTLNTNIHRHVKCVLYIFPQHESKQSYFICHIYPPNM